MWSPIILQLPPLMRSDCTVLITPCALSDMCPTTQHRMLSSRVSCFSTHLFWLHMARNFLENASSLCSLLSYAVMTTQAAQERKITKKNSSLQYLARTTTLSTHKFQSLTCTDHLNLCKAYHSLKPRLHHIYAARTCLLMCESKPRLSQQTMESKQNQA